MISSLLVKPVNKINSCNFFRTNYTENIRLLLVLERGILNI